MYLLTFGWLGYYALHSTLATAWLKTRLSSRWPRLARFYRLIYNTMALGLFVLLMGYQMQLPAPLLWGGFRPLLLAGYLLLLGGVLLGLAALRGYNLAEFGGWGYLRGWKAPASTALQTGGLNAWVRHPLYSGLLLVLGGYVLVAPTLPRLIFAACSVLYVLVGARLEEQKLLVHFGTAYAHYRRQVPMLLPRLRRLQ